MQVQDEESFLDKLFFYGDYLDHRTASGKEESGVRLTHKIDQKLTKEETAQLYDLVLRGFDFYKHLKKSENKSRPFNPFREKELKPYGIVDNARQIVARAQKHKYPLYGYTGVWAVWAWGKGNDGVRYVQAESHRDAIDQVLMENANV